MATGHDGGGPSRESTTPRWLPPAPPLLIQGGESSLDGLTRFTLGDFSFLNRSFSRECALPCGLAFQMHLLT